MDYHRYKIRLTRRMGVVYNLLLANFWCEVVLDLALSKLVRYLTIAQFVKNNRATSRNRRTRSGTSLLIMSCTVFDSAELFEKLTRYFRLNVNDTC